MSALTRVEFGNAYIVVDGTSEEVFDSIAEKEGGDPDLEGGWIGFTKSGDGTYAAVRLAAITGVWQLNFGLESR